MTQLAKKVRGLLLLVLLISIGLVGCSTQSTQEDSATKQEDFLKADFYHALEVDKLIEEGRMGFEAIYKEDVLKDFKLEFVQQSLERISKVIKLLPQGSNHTVYTTKTILELDNKNKIYEVKTDLDSALTQTLKAKIMFEERPYDGRAINTFELIVNLGEENTVKLSDQTKEIMALLVEECPVDEIEAILNKALQTGEKIFLIESGNKQVTIGGESDSENKNRVILWSQFTQSYPEE